MAVLAGVAAAGQLPQNSAQQCALAVVHQSLFATDDVVELDSSSQAVLGGSLGTLARHHERSNPDLRLVADARLDNRDELLESLAIAFPERSALSDADILLLAWSRWRTEALHRLSGSLAFVVHDRAGGDTILVRDHVGERPLNYGLRNGRLSFASMPSGVFPDAPLEPDLGALADQFRNRLLAPDRSNFHDIVRVPPAHYVTFTRRGLEVTRYWNPAPRPLPESHADLVAAFRESFDAAVAARLPSRSAPVSSMLSSGFDSGSVTGTAARLLDRPELLTAYTSAPGEGRQLAPPGRVADETAVAGRAARTLGIQHRIVRDSSAILDSVRGVSSYFEAPSPNPVNMGWWRAILGHVREAGQDRILTATEGNFTVSYGGVLALPAFIRRRQWKEWLDEIRHTHQSHSRLRWRGALYWSFSGLVPLPALRLAQRLFDRSPHSPELDFINRNFPDPAPPPPVRITGDLVKDRLALLSLHDNGERFKGMTALTGVQEIDPTTDRRFIELCLSLQPRHLLHRGEPRPLAREALSDRLDPQALDFTARGLQGANFYDRLPQADAARMLEEIRSTSAADLLDIPKLEAAIRNWPAFDPTQHRFLVSFAMAMWRSLSMGVFVAENEQAHEPARRR